MNDIDKLIEQSREIRLLYVEDNAEARASIQLILEEFFKHIVTAVDGLDGLRKFQENRIDLIITDLNMPRMSGLKMIEEIRRSDREVVILISSAYTEPEYFVHAIKLDVDGYLLKPFDLMQFAGAMRHALAKIGFTRAQQELLRQHHYLQAVIDGVSDPIMVIREDYTIELMNASLRERLDSSFIADLQQPRCYEVSHHRATPCDSEEYLCPLSEVMQKEESVTTVHTHFDPGLGERVVEISSSPLYDAEHHCIGIIETSRDLSEQPG